MNETKTQPFLKKCIRDMLCVGGTNKTETKCYEKERSRISASVKMAISYLGGRNRTEDKAFCKEVVFLQQTCYHHERE